MKKFIPVFLFLYFFTVFATAEDNQSVMPAQAGIQSSSSDITCKVRVISNDKYFPVLLDTIKTATKSIYACLYYISYFQDKKGKVSDILTALADAKGRGVTVEVILDRGYESAGSGDMSKKNLRAYSFLKQHEIPVFYEELERMTHSKYIIFDEKTVISGSFNWSEKAMSDNREDGYYIVSDEIAAEKLKEFRSIPRYSPEPVKDAIPIPLEFLRNKELAPQMMVNSNPVVFDFYLLCQKKSHETGSATVEFTGEEIKEYFYKDKKPGKGFRANPIQRFMNETMRQIKKKYPFIKTYSHNVDKGTLVIELTAENKPEEDSLYISPLFWTDGWCQRLSQRSKFCLFYILDKTSSGRQGRYFTQEKYDAVKEYGVGHVIFAYGTGELQKFNLIEKDINFRTGERNANGFTLNEFYIYSEFQTALDKLKSETDPDLFQTVSGLVESVNELSDLEVYKRYIYLGRKYGLSPLKQVLSLCKSHKNGISPYRQFAYVEQAIINAGERK